MISLFRSLLLGLVFLIFSLPAFAIDDDRMVGKQPVAKPRAEQTEQKPSYPRQDEERTAGSRKKKDSPDKKNPPAEQGKIKDLKKTSGAQPTATSEKTPPVNTPQPQTGTTMAQKAMESLGPLTNPLNGSLGSDMWDGTNRSVVDEFIPSLPTGGTLRSVQLLARRILLSNGDTSMMRDDAGSNSNLFSMRLEQLLSMGAYTDAVDLYILIQGEPSNDRLAQAGILALMNAGFPAQACLEVRATHHKDALPESRDIFWNQVESVCNFIQVESIQSIRDSVRQMIDIKGFNQSAVTGIPGSKVLTTLVSRADYRHVVSSPADLDDLSPLERGVLRGLGRFDYTRLKLKKIRSIPAPTLMLIAGDPNVPDNPRAALNIEAARRGLIDTDQLGKLYEELAKKNKPAEGEIKGKGPSSRLWDRYIAASNAVQPGEQASIIRTILESQVPGLPVALLPFSPMVSAINPVTLSPTGIRNGMTLMLYGNIIPPDRWVKAWMSIESGDSKKSRESILLYLANLVPENLPTDSKPFSNDDLATVLKPQESAEALAIWEVFSGLGHQNTPYNVADREFYEKVIDLTRFDDYVMPSEGFLERFRNAAQNDRLGETALLAAVALNEYSSGKTHPAVLREVLQNLETIGLKEDAQHIALGVILGLKQ